MRPCSRAHRRSARATALAWATDRLDTFECGDALRHDGVLEVVEMLDLHTADLGAADVLIDVEEGGDAEAALREETHCDLDYL